MLTQREAAGRLAAAGIDSADHDARVLLRYAAEAAAARRSQVRTVDRSERIRTYNYPENRVSDHRTGFKAYNLDSVLDGDLDALVQSAVDTDQAERLAHAADQ